MLSAQAHWMSCEWNDADSKFAAKQEGFNLQANISLHMWLMRGFISSQSSHFLHMMLDSPGILFVWWWRHRNFKCPNSWEGWSWVKGSPQETRAWEHLPGPYLRNVTLSNPARQWSQSLSAPPPSPPSGLHSFSLTSPHSACFAHRELLIASQPKDFLAWSLCTRRDSRNSSRRWPSVGPRLTQTSWFSHAQWCQTLETGN